MPAGRDLRKWARPFFTPEMAARGFALIKGSRFAYTREMNGVHQHISAQQSQWSPIMWLHVYMKGDEKTPGYVVGGRLGSRGVGAGGETWSVANEVEAEKCFPAMLGLIDQCAIPYFDKVKDLEQFKKVERSIRQRGLF